LERHEPQGRVFFLWKNMAVLKTASEQQSRSNANAFFGAPARAMTPVEQNQRAMSAQFYPKSTGSVLGASTGPGGFSGGGAPTPVQSGPSPEQLAVQNGSNQVRNDINSGYDSYFNSLNDQLNTTLPGQRAAQEGIANSQYQQGVSQLDTQKNLGVQDLNTQREKATTQQGKTLQDLTDNIRNLFQSGNTYLGARGAADSSAADQYSYALTKMGSKQRGDVTSQYAGIQNDINGRESRLNEIYNGQVKDLGFQRDQQINSIAQWFGEQQNALKQAQAQGQLAKGQDLASLSRDLLNNAMSSLQQVQQQHQAQTSALQEWAMNHSNDINSLKQNLSQVSQTNYAMPTAAPLNGSPSVAGGNAAGLFGYGNAQDQKTNLFGQPIR
jgi:hypothetical protein